MLKLKEKEKAIKLRKKGLSYREILKEVSVAKSTLSLWLRSVGLAKIQKQRLTKKRLAGALRGALARRNQRLAITKEIKTKAKNEIKKISKRELWFLGVALYWAEGSKQKEHLVSHSVQLGNSDSRLIKLFLKWLLEICKISLENIDFEIYIHETANIKEAKKYWARILNLPEKRFKKVRLKKHKIKTKRKNVGKSYHGLLRIRVKKSTNLNRKIAGWIEGISKNCGVV